MVLDPGESVAQILRSLLLPALVSLLDERRGLDQGADEQGRAGQRDRQHHDPEDRRDPPVGVTGDDEHHAGEQADEAERGGEQDGALHARIDEVVGELGELVLDGKVHGSLQE